MQQLITGPKHREGQRVPPQLPQLERLSDIEDSRNGYAHRAPLAFKAIMTIPQPSAFYALLRGRDGECPCCKRPFEESK